MLENKLLLQNAPYQTWKVWTHAFKKLKGLIYLQHLLDSALNARRCAQIRREQTTCVYQTRCAATAVARSQDKATSGHLHQMIAFPAAAGLWSLRECHNVVLATCATTAETLKQEGLESSNVEVLVCAMSCPIHQGTCLSRR